MMLQYLLDGINPISKSLVIKFWLSLSQYNTNEVKMSEIEYDLYMEIFIFQCCI